MKQTGSRCSSLGVGLGVVLAALAAAGCDRSGSKRPADEQPSRRSRPPRRLVARRFRTLATQPASAPVATGTAERPTPWKRVRPRSPEESFAFFRKLHRGAVLRVPRVAAAPEIDGALDEAYGQAEAVSFRFLDGRAGKPAAATTVRAVTTDAELFVFYDCRSPDMSALRATVKGRDAEVWNDDSVEMFLDAGNRRAATSYVHIAINPLGTVADSQRWRGQDGAKWDPKLRVKTKIGPDRWTVEVAIPLADLVADVAALPRVWAGNFNRMARLPAGSEDTAWCPTGSGNSHVPAAFGLLWLDAGAAYEDYSRWTGPRHVYAPAGKPLFVFQPVAPETLAECPELTANADRTYWFGVRTRGNVRTLLVLTDEKAVEVSSLHAWQPFEARWLNPKLLYVARRATEHERYYCIYDVERGKVVLAETESDGTDTWRRISEALRPPP